MNNPTYEDADGDRCAIVKSVLVPDEFMLIVEEHGLSGACSFTKSQLIQFLRESLDWLEAEQ